jgi:plasmid stabilization system protein ParE
MSVRLTPEAAADIREVFDWYREREPALGLEFLAAFAEVSRRIAEFPESAAEVEAGIRRAPLRRFPYCVFYLREGAGPVVLGCFHAHRDPQVWRLRGRT